MLGLAHLDRPFDYLVDTKTDAQAQAGVRVRVRFAGRLVDGYLLERVERSEHHGKLSWLDRVVSPERVLTDELATLCRAVADRYAGTLADVLRSAIPPRHARVEKEPTSHDVLPPIEAPVVNGWGAYDSGSQFVDAVVDGGHPHAGWQALPGEDVAARLAELAACAAAAGRGVVMVVPDQRDLDRLEAACEPLLGEQCVTLAAGLGPTARYRRWLSVLRGRATVVIGTRSAIFAPVRDIGLIVVFDDGDDSLDEPRSPYPHPREVGVLRAHAAGAALLVGGHARTAEVQALVESGWAFDVVGPRTTVRERMPRVDGLSDEDRRIAGDPLARAARIPGIAFDAARRALAADQAVLFSVPRRGYLPSVSCARCRAHARCRACNGPLQMSDRGDLACRWCARPENRFVCPACGGTAVRALMVGDQRTAEELGRAFRGVPVITSSGDKIVDEIPEGPRVVIATPGAAPRAPGGYGAAVLLDTWAQLDREDLRAAEEAVRAWMAVATLVRPRGDGGRVVVVADASEAAVQALIRWDPIGFASIELGHRVELGFPPAVTMASVDGPPAAVSAFLDLLDMPTDAETLGPVPLPPGVRRPAGLDDSGPVDRILLRTPRVAGRQLAEALRAAQALRNARHDDTAGIRVQIDPPTIG
ncbi:primosomal protein N' [Gordonia sp. (in: high G+C Gram-positive bacteria)]|uniref:primosomal protein N' n=1 Tax=Gordonia sp. (in: high G+C Gram-positive bacteria) TaxID=84139 RepID=UPI0016994467|nr:primosomal protein N' [Gordonia sp. (in: high G+C Gram-positive bacteria)]NLG47464.1 primosomal protein N' [Gordonia sp. (in: high G+C Gram-positive bacteria)]